MGMCTGGCCEHEEGNELNIGRGGGSGAGERDANGDRSVGIGNHSDDSKKSVYKLNYRFAPPLPHRCPFQ